jgi:hypothetical protein
VSQESGSFLKKKNQKPLIYKALRRFNAGAGLPDFCFFLTKAALACGATFHAA